VTYYTAGIVPPAPPPPVLIDAGVSWLSVKWSPPSGVSSDEALTYSLDVEEEGSVSAGLCSVCPSLVCSSAQINKTTPRFTFK